MKRESFLKKIKYASIGSAMADMALLLLVFFMATTTSEPPKGVDVELPVADAKGAEQDTFYLTIGSDGAVYLDGEYVTGEQLRDQLGMRAGEKDRTISITADKDLNYGQVASVLNILKEKEFLNVVFMSQPRE
ncbi:MAG: biopolymer transporter ExbD [Spirochaetes bacterium]|nr:biopolymer transporter ExbD [Spirochaetota bacterium]MBN2770089.1 biopolymer transporter ExbD [Spirochaetota bacterium]